MNEKIKPFCSDGRKEIRTEYNRLSIKINTAMEHLRNRLNEDDMKVLRSMLDDIARHHHLEVMDGFNDGFDWGHVMREVEQEREAGFSPA